MKRLFIRPYCVLGLVVAALTLWSAARDSTASKASSPSTGTLTPTATSTSAPTDAPAPTSTPNPIDTPILIETSVLSTSSAIRLAGAAPFLKIIDGDTIQADGDGYHPNSCGFSFGSGRTVWNNQGERTYL